MEYQYILQNNSKVKERISNNQAMKCEIDHDEKTHA